MLSDKKVFPLYAQATTDDTQLVKRFQRGETSVFNELMIRYQKSIYGLVYRNVHNHEDALDLTQDVFLKAYQGLFNFRKASQFYTWLYRIAVNLCIDFKRRNTMRPIVAEMWEFDDSITTNLTDANSEPPSKMVLNEELLKQIHQAIEQLSPMQYEIFVLHYREGLALKTIARKLNRQVGTIKAHLFFARKKLQHQLCPYLRCESREKSETRSIA